MGANILRLPSLVREDEPTNPCPSNCLRRANEPKNLQNEQHEGRQHVELFMNDYNTPTQD